jgi:hypothetical protein
MTSVYPGSPVPPWDPADGLPQLDNPEVSNVALEFGRMRTVGEYLAVNDAGLIPGRKYTDTSIGGTEARMHFQGIQRMGPPHEDILLLTGGDQPAGASHLFVCQLGSRPRGRPWGSNLRFSRKPPDADRLQEVFVLDRRLWHAGGISMLGDLLVVPLEDDATGVSRVDFIDMTDPFAPRVLSSCCISRSAAKAGAATLTRLPNQHYLCAVWSDSDSLPRRIDFYLSTTTDLTDGFLDTPLCWEHDRLLPAGRAAAAWQNINFVVQKDGTLFLIATENTSNLAPYVKGDDRVELLHVEFPPCTTHDSLPVLDMPTITRLAEKTVTADRDFGNLDAAGGVYLERHWSGPGPEPEARIALYSAYHWRVSATIRFIEYSRDVPASEAAIARIDDAWIDLFEHPNFRGQRLSIAGLTDTEIRDYSRIHVQDCGFSDRVSSVRYQLPPGIVYRLFRDDGFRPKRTGRGNLPLVGDGLVHEVTDLRAQGGFDNQASSSRYDNVVVDA